VPEVHKAVETLYNLSFTNTQPRPNLKMKKGKLHSTFVLALALLVDLVYDSKYLETKGEDRDILRKDLEKYMTILTHMESSDRANTSKGLVFWCRIKMRFILDENTDADLLNDEIKMKTSALERLIDYIEPSEKMFTLALSCLIQLDLGDIKKVNELLESHKPSEESTAQGDLGSDQVAAIKWLLDEPASHQPLPLGLSRVHLLFRRRVLKQSKK